MRRIAPSHLVLLFGVVIVFAWSGWQPHDRLTWWLEIFPGLAGLIVLIATYDRFRFTTLCYTLSRVDPQSAFQWFVCSYKYDLRQCQSSTHGPNEPGQLQRYNRLRQSRSTDPNHLSGHLNTAVPIHPGFRSGTGIDSGS